LFLSRKTKIVLEIITHKSRRDGSKKQFLAPDRHAVLGILHLAHQLLHLPKDAHRPKEIELKTSYNRISPVLPIIIIFWVTCVRARLIKQSLSLATENRRRRPNPHFLFISKRIDRVTSNCAYHASLKVITQLFFFYYLFFPFFLSFSLRLLSKVLLLYFIKNEI